MMSIRAVLVATLCVVLCPALADSLVVRADAAQQWIDIPAGDLGAALEYLSTRSGTGLVYRPDQVKGIKTRGVHGALSPGEAVTQLLAGTGLEVSTDSTGAMLI